MSSPDGRIVTPFFDKPSFRPLSMFALFLVLCLTHAVWGMGEANVPNVMQRGSFRLPGGTEIGDLVVSRGSVEIMGTVSGSVFVVDSRVTLFSGAVVVGNITVISGNLSLKTGSRVRGSVSVIGGDLEREDGVVVEGSVEEKHEELSLESRVLLWKYLVFERPVPPSGSPEESLQMLSQKLRGWKKEVIAQWSGLIMEGLPQVEFPESVASNARIGVWRRWDWELRIGVARFSSDEQASKMWREIHDSWQNGELKRAVHVSLGDGAHWFFISGDLSTLLWIRDRNLVMISVGPMPGRKGRSDFGERLRDEVAETIVRAWAGPGHGRHDHSH